MRDTKTSDAIAALVGFLLTGAGGWAVWHSIALPPSDMPRWAYAGSAVLLTGIVCLAIAGRRYQRPDLRTGRLASIPGEPEPTAELTGRIPCPSCREAIIPGATICPHCRRPIFAATPAKNAQIQMTIAIVTAGAFWLLWQWLMP